MALTADWHASHCMDGLPLRRRARAPHCESYGSQRAWQVFWIFFFLDWNAIWLKMRSPCLFRNFWRFTDKKNCQMDANLRWNSRKFLSARARFKDIWNFWRLLLKGTRILMRNIKKKSFKWGPMLFKNMLLQALKCIEKLSSTVILSYLHDGPVCWF